MKKTFLLIGIFTASVSVILAFSSTYEAGPIATFFAIGITLIAGILIKIK